MRSCAVASSDVCGATRRRRFRRSLTLLALAPSCVPTCAPASASAWRPVSSGGATATPCFASPPRRRPFSFPSLSRRLVFPIRGANVLRARDIDAEDSAAAAWGGFWQASSVSRSRTRLLARKRGDFDDDEDSKGNDDDDDDGNDGSLLSDQNIYFDAGDGDADDEEIELLTSLLSSSRPSVDSVEAEVETVTDTDTASSREYSLSAQDVRLFVTQRCIQSFMFLLSSMRDPHTVRWLDDLTEPVIDEEMSKNYPPLNPDVGENDNKMGSKLLNYHGLDALNATKFPTWDAFFFELLRRPDETLKITTPPEVGRRAYTDFDIDVEPGRLCSRILSVREQIAGEMAKDLEAIKNMGSQIWGSYWENAKNRRNVKGGRGDPGGSASAGNNDDDSSPYGFDSPSQMFLQFDPQCDADQAPSPLRKGNFDLLYKLITQESIVRLLESEDGVVVGEDEVQNRASTLFLRDFYRERLLTHFVGSHWFCKGDDFIEELILSSPIMLNRNEDDDGDGEKGAAFDASASPSDTVPPLVVEPLRIAEQILLLRDKLASEWRDVMEGIPVEHTEIRKLQLSRMMGLQMETDTDDFQ